LAFLAFLAVESRKSAKVVILLLAYPNRKTINCQQKPMIPQLSQKQTTVPIFGVKRNALHPNLLAPAFGVFSCSVNLKMMGNSKNFPCKRISRGPFHHSRTLCGSPELA